MCLRKANNAKTEKSNPRWSGGSTHRSSHSPHAPETQTITWSLEVALPDACFLSVFRKCRRLKRLLRKRTPKCLTNESTSNSTSFRARNRITSSQTVWSSRLARRFRPNFRREVRCENSSSNTAQLWSIDARPPPAPLSSSDSPPFAATSTRVYASTSEQREKSSRIAECLAAGDENWRLSRYERRAAEESRTPEEASCSRLGSSSKKQHSLSRGTYRSSFLRRPGAWFEQKKRRAGGSFRTLEALIQALRLGILETVESLRPARGSTLRHPPQPS